MSISVTTLIVGADGTMMETQLGLIYSDALQAIWEGQITPKFVWTVTAPPGCNVDVSIQAASDLADRTFREESTPKSVQAFCDRLGLDCWREQQEAFPRRRRVHLRHPAAFGDRQLGVGAYL